MGFRRSRRAGALAWLLLASLGAAHVPARPEFEPGTYKRAPGPRVGGFRRTYLLHVPRGYDAATPAPLVLALHGAFSGAKQLERRSGLSRLADREGFIVAYPNGIGLFGLLRHWNSGHCCGKARKDGIDDVGFVMDVARRVADELHVDTRRIYVVGYSNGGMLAHRIAAERADEIAAVAVVSGTIGGTPAESEAEWIIPQPAATVPIVLFHGRDDRNVPYAGGAARGKISAVSLARSTSRWIENNGCSDDPVLDHLTEGRILRESWQDCTAGAAVVRYTLAGWGHDWPGGAATRKLAPGDRLRGFEAAPLIWAFFENRRRESGSPE